MRKVNHQKNIIQAENVSFSYGKGDVIEGISLDVHEGDFLGVVGPNGSGKTTLLKIILGILPVSSGSVKLFGKDIREFKEWNKIGYVPQKVTNFDANFPVTVFEVAQMGRLAVGSFGRALAETDKREVEKALKEVGMWDLRDRLIGDLSGGQQQRVMIARALVSRPKVIFFDEPTSGIDAHSQENFYEILRKLNEDADITIVLVSHDIERVTKCADHIACVDRSLVCHMTPEAFVKESTYENLFGNGFHRHNHDKREHLHRDHENGHNHK